ncbi:MAG: hypothetical protein M1839_005305 [Geoglossum umbratile]|nr:MAG: hypothetical protein M1839_005305 [Geoglossum umbratile]
MANERDPLINSKCAAENEPLKEKSVSYMSLPHKGQLAILCVARLADSLATASIQAYLFYQLKFFDPSASHGKISTQAGIIVGAKTAAQVCTGIIWGRLADSEWCGRKPVLMIGMLLGPLFGGLLSLDEGKYPYAPPNLLCAGIFVIAAVGVFFGLEKTLETHNTEKNLFRRLWRKIKSCTNKDQLTDHEYSHIESSGPIASGSTTSSTPPPVAPKRTRKLPFWRIWTFNVVCTMLSHFIISGHLGTFSNLWAIYLSTPVEDWKVQHPPFKFGGGLGLHLRDVGFAASLLGIIGLVLQLAIYPVLNDRFGTVKIWRASLFIFPFVYIIAPYPSLVASAIFENGKTTLVWVAMSFTLLLFVTGRAGVTPATTLLINDCTPHPSARGTIHTVGTVMGHLARSVFPIGALAIFGQGLQVGVVGLGFWCLACLAILACVASFWVTEGLNGKEIALEGDEEDETDVETDARDGNGDGRVSEDDLSVNRKSLGVDEDASLP